MHVYAFIVCTWHFCFGRWLKSSALEHTRIYATIDTIESFQDQTIKTHHLKVKLPLKNTTGTVDGRNHQLRPRLVVYPIIYKVLAIPTVVGNGISEASTGRWPAHHRHCSRCGFNTEAVSTLRIACLDLARFFESWTAPGKEEESMNSKLESSSDFIFEMKSYDQKWVWERVQKFMFAFGGTFGVECQAWCVFAQAIGETDMCIVMNNLCTSIVVCMLLSCYGIIVTPSKPTRSKWYW